MGVVFSVFLPLGKMQKKQTLNGIVPACEDDYISMKDKHVRHGVNVQYEIK